MMNLTLDWVLFRLPRRGHVADDCEDAAAGNLDQGRFAVADGASESAHSGLWARLLVESFVAADGEAGWNALLDRARESWTSAVPVPAAELPWYLEVGIRQGAFATFLGVAVGAEEWHALAIGDSCLFQVRGDELVAHFPVDRSGDFGNSPWLVGSRPQSTAAVPVVHRRGAWQSGDRLWLMTDALAHWFLSETEAGRQPWSRLTPVVADGPGAFAGWVEDQRGLRRLRNDDVTLLAVNL
jgi:hypothetical protein